jgi:hypothetical protein
VGTDSAAPAEQAAMPPSLYSIGFCWVPIRLSAYRELLQQSNHWWVEKQGSVGMSLPTSDQKSNLQTRVRSTNTPLSFLARVKLQMVLRVLQNLYQRGATPLGFSIVNSTLSRRKFQVPTLFLSEWSCRWGVLSPPYPYGRKGGIGIGQRLAQKWAILHNAYLFASLIAPNA